jgi:hypothetical protein
MQWRAPRVEQIWRTPRVEQIYDAFAEPEAWDDQRAMMEHEALVKYTTGVDEKDLPEALQHMVVDLIDAGHYPSRYMLRMIGGELKSLYWPHGGSAKKERQHSKKRAWLYHERALIDYLAATKYAGADNPRTKAEEEFAAMHGITVKSLRRKRERHHAALKQSEEVRWQRRKGYPK